MAYVAPDIPKRPQPCQGEQDRFVLVQGFASAKVFVDALQRDVRRVILHESDVRREGHHQGEVEREVPPSTLLLLGQCGIEDPEQLCNPLLAAAMSGCRVLHRKGTDATVVASNPQSPVADPDPADEVHIREEAIDPDELLRLVPQLEILTRHFDLLELLESEVAEMRTELLQMLLRRPTVQFLLELIPPSAQFVDVFVHRGPVRDEVRLEGPANVGRQNVLGEPCDVGLRRRRQPDPLSVRRWRSADVLEKHGEHDLRRSPKKGDTYRQPIVEQSHNQAICILVRWTFEVFLDLIDDRLHR